MHHPTETVWTEINTRMGPMTLAATPRGLAGVWFVGQRHYPQKPIGRRVDGDAVLLRAQQELHAYLAGTRDAFTLPLDLTAGTPFQQSVWQALLQIPVGATRTYAAISAQIGRPNAMRAVGAAVGRNPVSIIVPCHRVIGANGSLTGYAGGLDRKAQLLALETDMATAPASGSRTAAAARTESRTIAA